MKLGTFSMHVDEMCRQRGISLKEAAKALMSWGIGQVCIGIDWVSNPVQERDRFEAVGLRVSDAFGNIHFITGKQEEEDIKRLVEKSALIGIERLQITTEGYTNPADEELCWKEDKKVAFGLSLAAKQAAEYGIQVVVEDYDVNNGPFTYGVHIKHILEQASNVWFAFDSGNFVQAGEDEVQNLLQMKQWLRHVHFKDRKLEKYRLEEETTETYKSLDGTVYYPCPVGAGIIRFPEIMRILEKENYHGTVLLEHFGASDQYTYLKESAAYVKGLERGNRKGC